ncbi:MAG: hypothetical protein MJ236_01160, partial [Clostridia bacterium]|nr:hypothetical protein [Clostridia bacterium]
MLPKIPYTPSVRKQQQMKFGGYTHTSGARDGAIYDMKNISADEYPILTPMKNRLVSPMVARGAVDFTFGTDGTPYYLVPSGDRYKFYKAEREVGETENTKLCRLSNKYIIIYSPHLTVYDTEADTLLSKGIPSDNVASIKNEPFVTLNTNITMINEANKRTEHIELYLYNDKVVANCDMCGFQIAKAFADAINGKERIKLSDKDGVVENWYYGGAQIDFENYQVKFDRDLTQAITPNTIRGNTVQRLEVEESGKKYILQGEAYWEETGSTVTAAKYIFYGLEVSGLQGGNEFYITAKSTSQEAKLENTFTLLTSSLEKNELNLVCRGTIFPIEKVERDDGVNKKIKITVTGESFGGINAFDIVVNGITLEFPEEMENVFQCNNRLWGTKGNHIYASALGDPYN